MEAPQTEKEEAKKDENNGIYIVIENNQKQPKDNYRIPIIKVLSSLHLMVRSPLHILKVSSLLHIS